VELSFTRGDVISIYGEVDEDGFYKVIAMATCNAKFFNCFAIYR